MSDKNFKAKLKKGVLEYCVLLALSKREMYTSELIEKLQEYELIVSEGTIYPLLNRIKREGLLEYKWEESPSGPPRKYYSLTDQGVSNLKETKKSWNELVKSIKLLEKDKDEKVSSDKS